MSGERSRGLEGQTRGMRYETDVPDYLLAVASGSGCEGSRVSTPAAHLLGCTVAV